MEVSVRHGANLSSGRQSSAGVWGTYMSGSKQMYMVGYFHEDAPWPQEHSFPPCGSECVHTAAPSASTGPRS